MQRNASPFRRWIRASIFDGWQALGAVGIVLGMVTFATLILNANHVLTTTGGTFKLVQTFSSDTPYPAIGISPSAEAPIPQPSAQPAVAPSPAPAQPRPTRSSVVRPKPAPSASPTPTETPSPTPTPSPSATPRPSIR